MPLFFFHLLTPKGLETTEDGIDLPSVERAYLEAYEAIPAIMAELVEIGENPMLCSFVIANERREKVMEVPFLERLKRKQHARPGQHDRSRRLSLEIAYAMTAARDTVRQSREILARARAS